MPSAAVKAALPAPCFASKRWSSSDRTFRFSSNFLAPSAAARFRAAAIARCVAPICESDLPVAWKFWADASGGRRELR